MVSTMDTRMVPACNLWVDSRATLAPLLFANFASTSFQNGQIGNPNGRPVESRNRRTKEIIDQIIKSNNKDPLITLSEISFTDPDSSAQRHFQANSLLGFGRAAAANMP